MVFGLIVAEVMCVLICVFNLLMLFADERTKRKNPVAVGLAILNTLVMGALALVLAIGIVGVWSVL